MLQDDFSNIQYELEDFQIFETDNPIYSLKSTEDEVSICAKTVFNITSLFPYQRLAISNILDAVSISSEMSFNEPSSNASTLTDSKSTGESPLDEVFFDEDRNFLAKQIILLPTGAGKSLCFQVPSLLLPTPTLVIYPLLALMADQMRRLKEVGIEPLLLRGGLSEKEKKEMLSRLESSTAKEDIKIIIANPEILQNEKILSRLKALNISHLVIDEAHCVSEWGDTFRPAYLSIKNTIQALKPKAITAFTATASEDVLTRIKDILFDGIAHVIRGETDRPNIKYFVKYCRIKYPALLETLSKSERPCVIFASSREGCERISTFIKYYLHTDEVKFYHAGLERAEKDKTEKWFNESDNGILVATCAWGMGVDKKNIRTVIHFEAPQTVEAYVQEAGRAGRDMLLSNAILLWSSSDKKRLQRCTGSLLSRTYNMISYVESKTCRRKLLLKKLGDKNENSKYAYHDSTHCSGCDVCEKKAKYEAEDENRLINLIKKYKNTFTQNDIINTIIDNEWRANDVNALVQILKSESKIIENKSFLWKNRLTVKKKPT